MKKTAERFFTPLALFALASLMMGLYGGLYNPSFNNYLDQVHHISEIARGGLEFPRELPGFLVVFVLAALIYLADTRIAAFSALLVGVALWGQGFMSPNMYAVVIWMFFWSIGAHLYMAVASPIGLRLATEGQEGRRLGQLWSLESVGTMIGMVIVYWGASRLHFSFAVIFGIAGICAILASVCLFIIRSRPMEGDKSRIVLKKKYRLFYVMNVLFGARKQVFLTFGPWLLIKLFHCGVATFAVLGLIGTVASILFRPLLGRMIDSLGERVIITAESAILIVICLLYGAAPEWLGAKAGLLVVGACYIMDQLLFSVNMARIIYLNRTVDSTDDIAPTISMGLTMDHAVSMLVPIAGGLIWEAFGYFWVFAGAGMIAAVNLYVASRIPDRVRISGDGTAG